MSYDRYRDALARIRLREAMAEADISDHHPDCPVRVHADYDEQCDCEVLL